MKQFMTFIWILVFGATIIGCTTFQSTQDSIRRACKSGVESYDDGTISYKCLPKESK